MLQEEENAVEPKFVRSPYFLVTQNEAVKGAILEISILDMECIPQALIDIVEQLPEDTLRFSIAIGILAAAEEPSVCLQLDGGRLSDKSLNWNSSKKVFLPTSAMKHLRVSTVFWYPLYIGLKRTNCIISALQEHLEDQKGLSVEIARYITSDSTAFVDPLFDIYHSRSQLYLSHILLQPGATEAVAQASHFTSAPEERAPSFLDMPTENTK